MTKFEFLHTLETALHGMPVEKIKRIVADHERHFEQGMAAGRSEADVARRLGDPWDIVARLRIPPYERAARGAAKAGRLFIVGLGLAVFNLFMLIPAAIYGTLLLVLYIAALACYLGGIMMTSAGLASVDEVVFRLPYEHTAIEESAGRTFEHSGRVRIAIGDGGIRIVHDANDTEDQRAGVPPVSVAAGAPSSSAASASLPVTSGKVVDDHGDGQLQQTLRGAGIVSGGILLLLLCGIATKYTWIGMERYARLNISVLRDA